MATFDAFYKPPSRGTVITKILKKKTKSVTLQSRVLKKVPFTYSGFTKRKSND